MKENREKIIKYFNSATDETGQAGIIILLMTVVLVTIGLSIASRSVTDIRFSKQEEETTRAFDAAEAGIEEALRQDLSTMPSGVIPAAQLGGIEAEYVVTEGNEIRTEIDEGETVEIDVDGYSGLLDIDWGDPLETCGAPMYASIVIATVDDSGVVERSAFTGVGCNRLDQFNNDPAFVTPSIEGYRWNVELTISSMDHVRIRAVYNGSRILVKGSGVLPAQFFNVHSEARSTGGESRAVEVTKTKPAPPSIFDFAIFSKGSLTK